MNLVALSAPPPFVFTLIIPELVPEATVARICVPDTTVTELANVPWNLTTLSGEKPVPLMVTTLPTGPLAGLKLVIVGLTLNCFLLIAVPPLVVTEMLSVIAPAGTVAVILVEDTTVKLAALLPNITADAPVKLLPLIVTTVPQAPLLGVKSEITGLATAVTVKFVALTPLPDGAVTVILPVPPAGAMAVICEYEFTVKLVAATVPN
jgi:hypothetical protein